MYPAGVEIAIAIVIIGALLIADHDRLQQVIERVRQLMIWLAE